MRIPLLQPGGATTSPSATAMPHALEEPNGQFDLAQRILLCRAGAGTDNLYIWPLPARWSSDKSDEFIEKDAVLLIVDLRQGDCQALKLPFRSGSSGVEGGSRTAIRDSSPKAGREKLRFCYNPN
jgi:hypothetical protein